MSAIITSDLHLTSAPRDEYRWRLFPWLAEQAQQHGAKAVYILGDLTDAKDYHSSRLVNRIVGALHKLYQDGGLYYIHILRGNHDGLDPTTPFFHFLSRFPWVRYYATPFLTEDFGGKLLLLPHTRDHARDWADVGLGDADMVFMHGTIAGAQSETGHSLQGIPQEALRPAYRAKIYSGDVHVPQTVGQVEYVGAPYPIRFGDTFAPRVLLLETARKAMSLQPPAFGRHVIVVTPQDKEVKWPTIICVGDQVKVKIRLAPHEYGDWERMKGWVTAACTHEDVELCGIELEKVEQKRSLIKRPAAMIAQAARPEEVLKQFCTEQKLDALTAEIGEELLRD